jgi:hypothetical protein
MGSRSPRKALVGAALAGAALAAAAEIDFRTCAWPAPLPGLAAVSEPASIVTHSSELYSHPSLSAAQWEAVCTALRDGIGSGASAAAAGVAPALPPSGGTSTVWHGPVVPDESPGHCDVPFFGEGLSSTKGSLRVRLPSATEPGAATAALHSSLAAAGFSPETLHPRQLANMKESIETLHASWAERARVRRFLVSRVRSAARSGRPLPWRPLVVVVGAHDGIVKDPIFGEGHPHRDPLFALHPGVVGVLRPLLPPVQVTSTPAVAPAWRPTVVFVEPVPHVMRQLRAAHGGEPVPGRSHGGVGAFHGAYDYGAAFVQAAVCNVSGSMQSFFVSAAGSDGAAADGDTVSEAGAPTSYAGQVDSLSSDDPARRDMPTTATAAVTVNCHTWASLLEWLASDESLGLPPESRRPDVVVVDVNGMDMTIVAQILDDSDGASDCFQSAVGARNELVSSAARSPGPRRPPMILFKSANRSGRIVANMLMRLSAAGYVCGNVSLFDTSCTLSAPPLRRGELAVVAAWYRENITWLAPFAPVLWVGSKGGMPAPPALVSAGAKVVPLPNIGREAHTYLTYIVDHYDALPEVVVFVQGEIAEHLPPGVDPAEAVRTWAAEAAADGVSSSFNLAAHDVAESGAWPRFIIKSYRGSKFDSGMNLGQFFFAHLGEPYPDRPHWYMSALFAARRDAIRSRPLSLWVALRDALPPTSASEEAHFMERMWYLLIRPPEGTTKVAKYASRADIM